MTAQRIHLTPMVSRFLTSDCVASQPNSTLHRTRVKHRTLTEHRSRALVSVTLERTYPCSDAQLLTERATAMLGQGAMLHARRWSVLLGCDATQSLGQKS